MMNVKVNGEEIQIQESLSISLLLQQLNLTEKKGLAVAVNEDIVPRSLWDDHLLVAQDAVIIIQAVAGG